MNPTNLDLLSVAYKKYVVTPLNAFGIGGFVFDVEGDTTLNLNAEITDHYLEDNSAVQDHIAIRPKRITLKRYVGELVYQQDDSVLTNIQNVTRKLTILDSFLPTLSAATKQIVEFKARDVTLNTLKESLSSKTINQVTDYWAFLKNIQNLESRQTQAYMYLKSIMESRMLVSVQTPFEFLNNMAIESIVAVQPEGQKYVSDFTITFKQLRFAELVSVPNNTVSALVETGQVLPDGTPTTVAETEKQGKAIVQFEPTRNNGSVLGTPKTFPTVESEWTSGGILAPPRNQ